MEKEDEYVRADTRPYGRLEDTRWKNYARRRKLKLAFQLALQITFVIIGFCLYFGEEFGLLLVFYYLHVSSMINNNLKD